MSYTYVTRFGHTWIHPSLNGTGGTPLDENFFNPNPILTAGSDVFIRNMYESGCTATDR